MSWYLVENGIVAAALAVIVVIACRLRRFRPAVCHALWLLVLLKLIIPPVVSNPLTVPTPWLQPAVLADAPTATVFSATEDDFAGLTASDTESAQLAPLAPPGAASPEMTSERPSWSWAGVAAFLGRAAWWVLFAWLFGTLAMAVVHAVQVFRFRRLLHLAEPAPPSLAQTVRAVAARMGVRPPPVLVVPGSISPVLWSLSRPKLVWPKGLFDRLEPDAWQCVIAHELAHLRRRDHWVGWLILAGECVWWWNPLFWFVRRRLHHWAELACDAWVVWTFPESRRRYADTLIEVSRFVSKASPVAAVGMSATAYHELERRLTMILRHKTPKSVPLWGLFLLALAGLTVLPRLSFSQEESAPLREAVVDVIQDGVVLDVGKRRWGPEQVLGAPDTLKAGDHPTAWAARAPDGGGEWLMLTYERAVDANAVRIYETFNPGAVSKVSLFREDGTEVVVWKGKDAAGKGKRVKKVAFKSPFPTKRVKIYFDTKRVKGWNEIDAVELVSVAGESQWAMHCLASSTWADGKPSASRSLTVDPRFLADINIEFTSLGRPGKAPWNELDIAQLPFSTSLDLRSQPLRLDMARNRISSLEKRLEQLQRDLQKLQKKIDRSY